MIVLFIYLFIYSFFILDEGQRPQERHNLRPRVQLQADRQISPGMWMSTIVDDDEHVVMNGWIVCLLKIEGLELSDSCAFSHYASVRVLNDCCNIWKGECPFHIMSTSRFI